MSAAELESLALRVLLASWRGPHLPPEWSRLLADGLGGVCLFGSNLTGTRADATALVGEVRAARPDALVATDEEGGDVTRLHVREGSPVPGAAALGAVDDVALTEGVGRAVGADLAGVGIDLALGPVADVNSNPDNPVIGTRSFGADPERVSRHVAAWVEGLQATGVAACVKHFPGHGDTAQDSHLTLPVLAAPAATLRERELPPFAAAVAAGAAAVMTSHLVVPAVDTDRPATFSPAVLGLLRDELGFAGAVVSDALDMAGASAGRGIPEAAVLALVAGADLLCVGPDKEASLVRAIQAAVVDAVSCGRLREERLREAADRAAGVRRAASGRAPDAPPAPEVMTAVARRAVVVEGDLGDLAGARVVTIDTEPNIAVGVARWGLDADVVRRPGEALPEGPLVVQVRDAHRRPDVGAMLAALEPPAVVVEWGWPGPRTGWPSSTVPRVCTRGSSAPAIAAVAEILGEAGWAR
ncbi:glycoside hydrolase family 3 N-terminal domain-containing protein [Nocardioides sp. SYSU DS0651]|uniref:glycoside hydrolase family 3 N-terminal domain-containing protein n=1 Tax=Nocardioides sp. SYSU DS0651 TaxID=3415955 RepID=UPI003F4B37ED